MFRATVFTLVTIFFIPAPISRSHSCACWASAQFRAFLPHRRVTRAPDRPIRECGLDRGDSPRFENDSNLRAQIHCENIAKVRFARQFAVFDYFMMFRVGIFTMETNFLFFTPFRALVRVHNLGGSDARPSGPRERVRAVTRSTIRSPRGSSAEVGNSKSFDLSVPPLVGRRG